MPVSRYCMAAAFAFSAALLPLEAIAQACDRYGQYRLTEIGAIGAGSAAPEARKARMDAWEVALRPVIEGRRIVSLGEPSHGDGASLSAKAEILEVLVERFGFEVVLFESDSYSMPLASQARIGDPADPASPQANTYGFWGDSYPMQRFWRIVSERNESGKPLILDGFDVRLRGRIAQRQLQDAVRAAFRTAGLTYVASDRKALSDLLASDLDPRLDADERTRFLQKLADAENSRALDVEAAVMLRTVRDWGEWAWKGRSRDEGMARVLEWKLQYAHADRKVVIWAHTNHMLKDPLMWRGAAEEPFPRHAGNLIAPQLIRETALIAFVASGGEHSFLAIPAALDFKQYDASKAIAVSPRSADAIESHLSRHCKALTLVNLRVEGAEPFLASAIDHMAELKMDYAVGMDALIYIGSAAPLSEKQAPP